MKQVLRRGLREIVVEEVPDPVVIPHHVLIQPVFSLISSGTETASIHQQGALIEVAENPSHLRKIWEVMKVMGPVRTMAEVRAKLRQYAVLGYSGAGIIVDKHATVAALSIGDRVAYGGEGTGHAETILAGRNLVARVPESVPLDLASFTTLGSIALNAVRISNIGVGEVVAIIGVGLVGQLLAQLVRLQGGVVIAIDLKSERVQLAKQLGADVGLVGSPSVPEEVKALTDGRGADCVIVAAASKSAAPCRQALDICRDRGRLVIVGAVTLDFPWNDMYRKEIRLLMSRAYGPGSYDPSYEIQGQDYPISYVRWTENRNMEEFLRLVALGRVQLGPLITHQFPLEQAAQGYQTILDPSSNCLAVLLRYPTASAERSGIFTPRRKVEIAARSLRGSDLRVGLVGAGNLARWAHLPNLKKIPHATLQAVFSTNGARGKEYAHRFGAAYCCSSYDEVLQDPDIDVVMIVSRNQHHYLQAMSALQAGKHVFLEKPMALTEEECQSLCHEVERTGKCLTVGFNRRFAPLYVAQRDYLARRTSPAVISCCVNSPGISGSYWMADPGIGGAILGEACHFVDLMYWLLSSEPIAVSAYCLPTGRKEPIGENNIVASIRFVDGSIGHLTYCTTGSKASGGERVDVFIQGLRITVENFKRISLYTEVRRTRSFWRVEKGHAAHLASFLDAIRTGKQPEITVQDGARATLVCLRILESARNLKPCEIDLQPVLG